MQVNPKIIFTDIDGTLLTKNKELSPLTISEIKRIREVIPVVLISSRMPAAMRHLQESLGLTELPLIAYNGGLIVDKTEILQSTTIDIQHLKTIVEFNKKTKVHLSLYYNDEWYVPELDYWANREINNTKVKPIVLGNNKVIDRWKEENKGAHKIMCMGEKEFIDQLYTFLQEHFSSVLHCYRSKDTYIEIADKTISKKTAVGTILDKYKLTWQDCLAFGDNFNDQTMLEAAGTGVAVANAKEAVLKVANQVTLAGDQNGVATFIQNHIKL